MGRLVAGLAVEAAGEAAEAVDVGPPGVVGYAPGFRVERVLLVDVVVLSIPGGRASRKQEEDGEEGREEEESTLGSRESQTAPDEVLTCCPLSSRAGRRRTA